MSAAMIGQCHDKDKEGKEWTATWEKKDQR